MSSGRLILPTPPSPVNVEKSRAICLLTERKTEQSGFQRIGVCDPRSSTPNPHCGNKFLANPQISVESLKPVDLCGKPCGNLTINCGYSVRPEKLLKFISEVL